VELPDDMFITLPVGYEHVTSENCVLAAADAKNVIMVKMMDDKEYDRGKFMQRADRIFFSLGDYTLIDKTNEKFRQIDQNYVRKYYKSADGARLLTHTAHTRKSSYIVLATYSTAEELETIEKMLDGIEVVPQKWIQRIWYLFDTGLGCIILVYLLLSLLVSVIAKGSPGFALILGLAGYCLLFSCCWGDWPVYLTLVGVGFLMNLAATYTDPSEVLQSIADGI
jgi:hypothetical protein